MQQPEVYLGHADELFDKSDKLKNEKIEAFLLKFIDAYSLWAAKICGAEA